MGPVVEITMGWTRTIEDRQAQLVVVRLVRDPPHCRCGHVPLDARDPCQHGVELSETILCLIEVLLGG